MLRLRLMKSVHHHQQILGGVLQCFHIECILFCKSAVDWTHRWTSLHCLHDGWGVFSQQIELWMMMSLKAAHNTIQHKHYHQHNGAVAAGCLGWRLRMEMCEKINRLTYIIGIYSETNKKNTTYHFQIFFKRTGPNVLPRFLLNILTIFVNLTFWNMHNSTRLGLHFAFLKACIIPKV